MNFWTKDYVIPDGKRTIEGAQTWEVRWQSRSGEFSSDTKPELAIFFSESDANDFAQALRDAFTLIRYKSAVGTQVTVRIAA